MNNKFKNIIQEKVKSSKCIEQFGEYLFGEFKPYYKKEVEKNTDYENIIWRELEKFVGGTFIDDYKSKILVNGLQRLHKCMKDYPDILMPNKNKIYRGKRMDFLPKDKLEGNNLPTWKDYGIDIKKKEYVYKPNSEIQSWTTDYNKAKYFGKVFNPNKIGIVFSYKYPNNEFLFSNKFLNMVADDIVGEAENEVIRVSKKPIKCKIELLQLYSDWDGSIEKII